MLHTELLGGTWPRSTMTAGPDRDIQIGVPQYLDPLHLRMPNSISLQSQILPMVISIERSGYHARIAQIPNMGVVRVDWMEPGDIIYEGSQKWKTFPWALKNASARDGGNGHSGTFGYAVKYDGP